MAKFNYEKWSTYNYWYFGSSSSSTSTSTSTRHMYSSVRISNDRTGTLSASGSATVRPGSRTSGYTFSGRTRIRRSYNGSSDQLTTTNTSLTVSTNRRKKDQLLGIIVAENGEFPDDGFTSSDSHWYVKTNIAETAELSIPGGGETFNKEETLTWMKSTDDINVDIELSTDGGQSWKRILSNVSGSSAVYNFEDEQETPVALMRIRPVYGTAYGAWSTTDNVFTIRHDFAPQAPTNLRPKNILVSKADLVNFNWRHNHPLTQSRFDLRWSTNQVDWNDVTRMTTDQSFHMSGDIFPSGNIYWQVRTYSDMGLISPWSEVTMFIAAIPSDAPIITSEPNTAISRPVFKWSQSDQVAYQIIILDSVNNEVWNTGEVTSSNKAVTSGVDLLNHSTYKFRIRTKTELGLWTHFSEQTITVSYTPPARPTVIVDMTEAGVSFNINNPEPTGTEPFHSHNDLYKFINGRWVRIAKELQSEYTDHSLASEEVAVYRIRAVSASNGTFRDSEVIEVTGKLKGIWIYDVENPSETLYMFLQSEPNAVDVTYDREHGFRQFVGRKQPSIEWGSSEERIINARLALRDEEKEYEKLAYFPMNGSTVLYRDYRGRKMYGVITEIQSNDQFYGNTVAVQITEIDYTEGV